MENKQIFLYFTAEIIFSEIYKDYTAGRIEIYTEDGEYSIKEIRVFTNKFEEFQKYITSLNEVFEDDIPKIEDYIINTFQQTPWKMREKLEDYLKLQEEVREELKVFVKDKSISLDERWDLFIVSELGDYNSWYLSLEGMSEDVYGGYYEDRHEVIKVDSLIEMLEENPKFVLTSIEKIKQEILEKFIYSFEFDW